MNSRSDPSSRARWRVTIWRPFCQVVSTVNTTMPMASGSQAPCGSLVRLAAKNSPSTVSSSAAMGMTRQSGHRHCWRTM